jgi:hypothetical protein
MELGKRYYVLPYLLPPFLLLIPFNLDFIINLLKMSKKLLIFLIISSSSVLLFFVNRQFWFEHFHTIWIFDLAIMILFFVSHLFKKKYIFYGILCYFLLMTILTAIYGRRGLFVEYLLVYMFLIIIRYKSTTLALSKKIITGFALTLIILLLVMTTFFVNLTTIYIFERGFSEEAWEYSRGDVIAGFFNDFKTNDYIFGRGLDGLVIRGVVIDKSEASTIENGLLHILLKGGGIYLLSLIPYFGDGNFL